MTDDVAMRLAQVERQDRRLRACVVALALVSLVPWVAAQPARETMVLGGQTLWPGMPKSDVLAKLQECCTLSNPNGDSSFVRTKAPSKYGGTIWFSDGKLETIEQDVDSFRQPEAVNLGQALYRSALDISKSKSAMVMLSTNTLEATNGTGRRLILSFTNGRSLQMEVVKLDAVPSDPTLVDMVTVSQSLTSVK